MILSIRLVPPLLLLLLLAPTSQLAPQLPSDHKFRVLEETAADTVLGSLLPLLPVGLTTSATPPPTFFSNTPLVRVNERADLVMARVIDLEKVCTDMKLCCGKLNCHIPVIILVRGGSDGDGTHTLSLRLDVEDRNDNLPRFATPTQSMQVFENEPLGTRLALQPATDADVSPANKVSHYSLRETSGTFEIDRSRLPAVALLLRKHLDYEKRKVFYATLDACDMARQCSSQKIEINVVDRNDNFPVFTKSEYLAEVFENFPVGQQVLRVEAMDNDSAEFSQVMYGFHGESAEDTDLRQTFIVTENTGSVKLQRPLSAHVREQYRFSVFAVDRVAGPSSQRAVTRVLVTVKDLNDHSPIINLLGESSGRLQISENEAPREIVALQVKDEDVGNNANVSCNLENSSKDDFKLSVVSARDGVYSLASVRPFDFETERQVRAIVNCHDMGEPSLSVRRPLTVAVLDFNEHAPRCQPPADRVIVAENRPPGQRVFKVTGTDEDGSAVLRFSLAGGAAGLYFSVDATNGEIMSGSRALDRESLESIELIIKVTDSETQQSGGTGKAGPGRIGECRVTVIIGDENDNSPRFTMEEMRFLVTENRPAYSRLDGFITAMDDDKDEHNSRVMFSLTRLFDDALRLRNDNVFQVKEDGALMTLQRLDREASANYTLEVRAYDAGSPSRSSLMNVSVSVLDENDNAPVWVQPPPTQLRPPPRGSGWSLNISATTPPGLALARLSAHDPDQADNGRVSYAIIGSSSGGGADAGLFLLNDSTGELSVARLLPLGAVQLLLRASDHGSPAQHTDTTLALFITGDDLGATAASLNVSIILVLIGVTGLISLFLIVAIVCVRRKPHYGNGGRHHHQQTGTLGPPSHLGNGGRGGSLLELGPGSKCDSWLHSPPASVLDGGCYQQQQQHMTMTGDLLDHRTLPMHTFLTGGKTDISPPLLSYHHSLEHRNSMFSTLPTSHSGQGVPNRIYTLQQQQNNGGYTDMSAVGLGGLRCSSALGQPVYDLDDDSADSGKGGSEDDVGLQHQLPLLGQYNSFDSSGKNRLYTTMPFQNRLASSNRLLTSRQRANLPHNINQCPCYILPEDSIVLSDQNSSIPFHNCTAFQSDLNSHDFQQDLNTCTTSTEGFPLLNDATIPAIATTNNNNHNTSINPNLSKQDDTTTANSEYLQSIVTSTCQQSS